MSKVLYRSTFLGITARRRNMSSTISNGSKGAVICDDKGRICNAAGPITSGHIYSGSWTPTVATTAGFAGATNFSVTTARYRQVGNLVDLDVLGVWQPNAATATGTITLPTNMLPPITSTVAVNPSLYINPAAQGSGVGTITSTIAAASNNSKLSISTVTGGTSNLSNSTFNLRCSYNLV
jgi:hypothetical protein